MKLLLLGIIFLSGVFCFASVKVGDFASYNDKDVDQGNSWFHSHTLEVTKVNSDGSYTMKYDYIADSGAHTIQVIDTDADTAKAQVDFYRKYLIDCAGNGGVSSHKIINGNDLKTCIVPTLNGQGVQIGDLEYSDIPFYLVHSYWSMGGDGGEDSLVSFHN